jgi:predicted short-subunit dehydrogenase-like oxidoreductase (DUF2520 family)
LALGHDEARGRRQAKDFHVHVTSGPLSGLAIALVGPGRVGTSVARWCLASGATVRSVTRQGRRALPRWGQIAGARSVALGDLEATDCDLLLLAVPDSALAGVAATLAVRPQAGVVLHTSGRLDAEVLAPLRRGGCAVGGLHPLRAFARPLPALTVARRTFLALQGDPAARELGARIAAGLGAPHAEVPESARALYHLAATWAAGGSVTLLGAAVDLHARAGVDAAAAPRLGELARGALAAVADPAGRSPRSAVHWRAASPATWRSSRPLREAFRRSIRWRFCSRSRASASSPRGAALSPSKEALRSDITRGLRGGELS